MFAWLALNFVMRFANVFCWLSSSPPPRQQNHLMVTGPPGGTVAGPVDAGAWVGVGAEVATDDGEGLADPPHATTTRPITAAIARLRRNWVISAPPPYRPATCGSSRSGLRPSRSVHEHQAIGFAVLCLRSCATDRSQPARPPPGRIDQELGPIARHVRARVLDRLIVCVECR